MASEPDVMRRKLLVGGAMAGAALDEDISPAAVFLASDAAAQVTGAEDQVTGGDV